MQEEFIIVTLDISDHIPQKRDELVGESLIALPTFLAFEDKIYSRRLHTTVFEYQAAFNEATSETQKDPKALVLVLAPQRNAQGGVGELRCEYVMRQKMRGEIEVLRWDRARAEHTDPEWREVVEL